MTPIDHSAWRRELAQELAERYKKHDNVRMIVLGGSPTRGLADAYSDLDVIVYWDDVDTAFLEAEPLKGLPCERLYFRPMGEKDVYLESYYFGPLKTDFGHAAMALWEQWTADVLENHKLNPGVQKSMAGFLASVPLHGHDLVASWKERLRAYPEPLAEKMVRSHLRFFQKGSLLHQGWDRSDLVFFYDGLCQSLKNLLAILAGLNRVYFSTDDPRWIGHELASMKVKPRDGWARMQEVLTAGGERSAHVLEGLVDEVFDLVEVHMPAVDLARLRKLRAVEVNPCEDMPSLT